MFKHPVARFTSLKFNFYKLCFSLFDLLCVCYPLLFLLSCFSLFPSACNWLIYRVRFDVSNFVCGWGSGLFAPGHAPNMNHGPRHCTIPLNKRLSSSINEDVCHIESCVMYRISKRSNSQQPGNESQVETTLKCCRVRINSRQQSPFEEIKCLSNDARNSQFLMEPEPSVLCPRKMTTGRCLDPDYCSLHSHILLL